MESPFLFLVLPGLFLPGRRPTSIPLSGDPAGDLDWNHPSRLLEEAMIIILFFVLDRNANLAKTFGPAWWRRAARMSPPGLRCSPPPPPVSLHLQAQTLTLLQREPSWIQGEKNNTHNRCLFFPTRCRERKAGRVVGRHTTYSRQRTSSKPCSSNNVNVNWTDEEKPFSRLPATYFCL